MKTCKNCCLDETATYFSGDYRYCQACHEKYRNERNQKRMSAISKDTVVYFIRDKNLIKIGYTSDIDDRVSNIKTGNPNDIELLKTIGGGREKETELHKQFEHLWKCGEWFHATKELIDFIETL